MAMRDRKRVLDSLESVYQAAFEAARAAGDDATMARLDFEYQREQIQLEVLLDIRDLLRPAPEEESDPSLLEKAQALRNITRLKMP